MDFCPGSLQATLDPLHRPVVAPVPFQHPPLVVQVVPPHLLPAPVRLPGLAQEVPRRLTPQSVPAGALVLHDVHQARRPAPRAAVGRPRVREHGEPARLQVQEEGDLLRRDPDRQKRGTSATKEETKRPRETSGAELPLLPCCVRRDLRSSTPAGSRRSSYPSAGFPGPPCSPRG